MLMMHHRLLPLSASILAVTFIQAAGLRSEETTPLHGWEGEAFSYEEVFPEDLPRGHSAPSNSRHRRWVETISWEPRAFVFHNLLTPHEADEILYQAAPHLKRSTVVDSHHEGKSAVDNIRTSYGMFLPRLSSPALEALERRVANWTHVPIANQEDAQVLRYEHGQKYGAHQDSLGRMATVVTYLVDTEEGGETTFSRTTDEHWAEPSQVPNPEDVSPCARGRVAFKPKKGDAVLFYSLKPDGQTVDPFAEHTACPIVNGLKWTAIIWIHPEAFRPEGYNSAKADLERTGRHVFEKGNIPPQIDPEVCMDNHPKCRQWATAGACTDNAGFMTGENAHNLGTCRKSCGTCTMCTPGDKLCYAKNREQAGFLDLREEVSRLTGLQLPYPAN